MTEIGIPVVNAARGARFDDEHAAAAAVGLAKFLCLAATPTFALMGLLTGLMGTPMDGLCSSAHGALLSGMVPMYLFMSAFHAPPWLKLIFGRRGVSRLGMKAGGKTAGLLLVLAHRFFRCRDHTFSKHEPALNEEARFPNPHLEALEGKSPALSRRQNSG